MSIDSPPMSALAAAPPIPELSPIRVCCVADLHGMLPPWDVPECDLLLVAGDVGPDPERLAARWLREELAPWLGRQPAGEVVAVVGNHDHVAGSRPELVRGLPWRFLHDEAAVLDRGLRVYGSPWTPKVVEGWAFTACDNDLAAVWERIPEDTQVLLVHGPPYGVCDSGSDRALLGSWTLRSRLDELAALELVVCGHVHEARGIATLPGGVTVVNAALVDEHYRLAYEPILVELAARGGGR